MSETSLTVHSASPCSSTKDVNTNEAPVKGLLASRAAAKKEALEKEIAELEAKLGGQDPQAIVNHHIALLHTYNEIKDAAQTLIGKYAVINRTTIRAVHEQLDLSLVE